MKKIRYLILAILTVCCLAALAVAGCGKQSLSKPANLTVNETTLVLSWQQVPKARRYTVKINDVEKETRTNSYSLEGLAQGEYTITVKARGNDEDTKDSGWSDKLSFTRDYEPGFVFALKSRTEYEVTGAGLAEGNVVIPDFYRGKPVTSIGTKAFANKTTLTGVVLGNNITSVKAQAFYNCSYLTSVTLNDSLVTIGERAFQSCRILSNDLVIPDSVTEIGENAFAYCRGLSSVEFGNKLEKIAASAFSECDSLGNVIIPESVKQIGSYAFSGCTSLSAVLMGGGVETVGDYSFKDCSSLREIVLGNKVSTIGIYAFNGCSNMEKAVIPDSVEQIGEYAFAECRYLDDITLSNNLKKLGTYAFYETAVWTDAAETELIYVGNWFIGRKDLTAASVVANQFKQGTVGIANNAFYGWNKLTQVSIPDSVKYLGDYAFNGCKELSGVVLGGGVKIIGDYAFNGCEKLVTVRLGKYDNVEQEIVSSSLEKIGSYAFRNCTSLNEIDIPETVTEIGTRSFYGSGLWKSAGGTVRAGNWIVDYNPPAGLTILSVSVPDGIVGIANYAFYNSNLMLVDIADSVKYMGRGAFYQCGNLTQVKLPSELAYIPDYAFYKCSSLTLGAIPETVKSIGRSAFYDCTLLGTANKDENGNTAFTIPDSVEFIDAYAFYGCGYSFFDNATQEESTSGINTLIIGNGVTTIGDNAFSNFSSLKEVIIGDGVVNLGNKVFYKNQSLEKVTFGKGLTEIPDRMFYGCNSLKYVIIPSNIKHIGDYAFYKCESLISVRLSEGVESIGSYAFYGSAIQDIILPSSLSKIGNQAFRNCASLTSIILTENIKEMTDHAFYGCTNLTVYTTLDAPAEGWGARWNSSYRPVVWGVTLSEDGTYVVSFTRTRTSITNINEKITLSAPVRSGYEFAGWATAEGSTEVVYSAEEVSNAPEGTVLYAVWKQPGE